MRNAFGSKVFDIEWYTLNIDSTLRRIEASLSFARLRIDPRKSLGIIADMSVR